MLTVVNCMKVKWGAILQVISTVAKVLALIVIIITGLVKLAQGTVLVTPPSVLQNKSFLFGSSELEGRDTAALFGITAGILLAVTD